jgi:soluble lytic murein transglycosylase
MAAGATISATEALTTAMSLGAWDFYGLRASDLLLGRAPFAPPQVLDTACTSSAAQDEAEIWLRSWLGLAPDAPVGVLTTTLQSDLRLQRGTLLLRLGHFDEGKGDLEALRVATTSDPLAQYQLALYFRDVGLYRSSIIAASALWRLSPAGSLPELPTFIGCLAYPMYYRDLVEQEAAAQDLNALFVYALLRQESLFEGYATSFAAAHGLMQVIPPTGAYIAQQLAWPPGYETPDLYRPMVSVRFGTWYLAEQRDLLDDNLFGAMAAYNGGPGNALHWWESVDKDPDLFVERIGFRETRTYVRVIREHYARYRWLYGGGSE